MFKAYFIRFIFLLLCFSSLNFFNISLAADKSKPETYKVVIHVTNGSKQTYRAAVNYSYSLKEEFADKVKIVVVANGPGIGIVNKNNKFKEDIEDLMKDGVDVYACNTTVRIMRKYQELHLIKGVKFTPTGVVEVVKLQHQGYHYLHP